MSDIRKSRLTESVEALGALQDLKSSKTENAVASGILVQVAGDGLESASDVGTVVVSNFGESQRIAGDLKDAALQKRALEASTKMFETMSDATGKFATNCATISGRR